VILLPEARRRWRSTTWVVAISYAVTLVLFVAATKLTTSANAIFLQSTAPFYLLLLGPFVLREPIRRIDLVVISAVGTGAILLLFGSQPVAVTAPDPVRGNFLGISTGLTWALTLTGLRWVGKRAEHAESPATVVTAGNLIACLACLPIALPVTHAGAKDMVILLYLGIFQIGFAYAALARSIRHVPGLEAATLLLIEPVFNPIWTWLIHGEQPSRLALAGGALIIMASFVSTWWQARQRSTVPTPERVANGRE
jgi:drug/metabolite transporter, DME family